MLREEAQAQALEKRLEPMAEQGTEQQQLRDSCREALHKRDRSSGARHQEAGRHHKPVISYGDGRKALSEKGCRGEEVCS